MKKKEFVSSQTQGDAAAEYWNIRIYIKLEYYAVSRIINLWCWMDVLKIHSAAKT